MLTRQWCDALDLLRCYVRTWVMLRSWLSSVLCSRCQWCYVASFLWGETLRKNTSKKHLKNIQVLAAASLHRQPGLKAILNAMTVYRKDCLAGRIKLSPSDAFKVAKLHWMSWNTRKKTLTCGQMAFRHIFPLEISRNHDKTPSFKQFQPTARQRFARIYIYLYTHIISHTYIYIRDIYIYKPIYKHVFNWPFHVQPWRLFCLRQPGLANSLRPGPGPGNKFTYCIEPLDYTIHIIRCLTIGFGDTPNINCVCIYIYIYGV